MARIAQLETLINNPAIRCFLNLIAFSEGVITGIHPLTKNDGYDVIVTSVNGPSIFADYSRHPFEPDLPANIVRLVPRELSTASGRYQIIRPTWIPCRKQLELPDFGPKSQDMVAIELMYAHGAVAPILAGDIRTAIIACSKEWASFPASTANQPKHSMQTLLARYKSTPGANNNVSA